MMIDLIIFLCIISAFICMAVMIIHLFSIIAKKDKIINKLKNKKNEM